MKRIMTFLLLHNLSLLAMQEPSRIGIMESIINCNTQDVLFARLTSYRQDTDGTFFAETTSTRNQNARHPKIYTNDQTQSIASSLESYTVASSLQSVHEEYVALAALVHKTIKLKGVTVQPDKTLSPWSTNAIFLQPIIKPYLPLGQPSPAVSISFRPSVTENRILLDPVALMITAYKN